MVFGCYAVAEPGLSWVSDLQMVNISLRVLSKPDVADLSTIFKVNPRRPCSPAGLSFLTDPDGKWWLAELGNGLGRACPAVHW